MEKYYLILERPSLKATLYRKIRSLFQTSSLTLVYQ